MPRWLWIALGTAVVLFVAGAAGWALRDSKARLREQAARDRATADSIAQAGRSHYQDSVSAVTRDSIARARAELVALIGRAEEAAQTLAASAAYLNHQAALLHVKLDSAGTARDSVTILVREVGALQGTVADLGSSNGKLVEANAGLHHQLTLDTLDRINDAKQAGAHLDAANATIASLHQSISALGDTIVKLRNKGYLFGLHFLPKPELIVGYGVHLEQPRQACAATLGRLPAGAVSDPVAVCAGEAKTRVVKGFHLTLGFHLPI